ncbi:EVE domain-containing protein [Sphingomonas sp.]|uniref:EVE domain-containing protein n=1 Tax=Sphingomonas sp. TaxID=28214 RepID=UPI002B743B26|nr:EVE domain-containing protein [Sphingomonas sp.]HWK36941.1 EVE domain-containing protein [Sphingomonas sp.]
MAHWLMRSEPETYGWDDLIRDGATEWDGVRNATARIFLRQMAPGDQAFFYHSGKQKAAVGIMEVTRAWRPDGDDGAWASVAVKAVAPLAHPVTLAEMKAEPRLKGLEMLRLSRLSVTPVRDEEWAVLLEMANG